MDDESKFWLRLCQSVAVAVVIAIATIGGCTVDANHKVAEMVNHGSNPIDAACAIWGDTNNTGVCILRATNRSAGDQQ